ncbi:hypothetical protein JTB14_019938 [Gonioctena quinquepunctata]|nr:hypothetical protein JTB14_019938 [Gonioctena quinquepunctata]
MWKMFSRRRWWSDFSIWTDRLFKCVVKHFRDNHRDNLLDSPSVEVKMTVPCSKTYLYRVEGNIFFIECKITPVEVISLNIIYLGGQKDALIMKQKFGVQCRDETTIEAETICNFLGSKNTAKFSITMRKLNSEFVRVQFHLKILEVYTLAETNSSKKFAL